MILKRIYSHTTGKPVLGAVKVVKAGPVQKFTPRIIDKMRAEGTMELVGDILYLRTDPPLHYKIVAKPGTYCCYCGVGLDTGQAAKDHVAEHRNKAPTIGEKIVAFFGIKTRELHPDPTNPAGYRTDNFYLCERV